MVDALQTFLAVIFVFGLLITSHELGHFVVAKLSGVKVLEFSLGMGPKLLGFTRNETKYSLRLFPIGGYVKMLGEEEDSSDPSAFCNKSPWAKIPIIVAGAFMNFVVAVILFAIVFYNTGVIKPIISEVQSGYPALEAGLMKNDKIVSFNDKKVSSWREFSIFVYENGEKQFNLAIQRGKEIKKIDIKPIYDNTEKRYLIGIKPKVIERNVIESVKAGFIETKSSIKQMLGFLGGIFKGKMSFKDVGGPVAIVKLSGEAARIGIWSLLFFAGFLSINLGIFNLIPFPALDGGWVVILLIEGISGKKIDQNKLGIINLIGFSLLIVFAILVTFKDVLRFSSY